MKPRLLAIEPDPFDREVIKRMFSREYHLSIFTDIDQMCAYGWSFIPQVVLCTVDSSGIGSIEKLKRHLKSDTPIIVLANENRLDFERTLRELGVFYYLIKPYELKELHDAITAAFEKAVKSHAHAEKKGAAND